MPLRTSSTFLTSTSSHLTMDPAPQEKRPKAQPSRKGKRAWRKNVDVSEIDQALEYQRDQEILHGDQAGEDEFVIDTEGKTPQHTAPAAKLKTTEILTNKSKVQPVRQRPVKKPVSRKERERIMALAGRLATANKLHTRIEKDGLVKGSLEDVWEDAPEPELPMVYKESAYSSHMKPKHAPGTMKEPPIPLTIRGQKGPDLELVDAGKSYNPSLELWRALIEKEFGSEKQFELQRQQLAEEQERIQHLIETMPDENFVDDSADEAPEEEEEEQKDEEDIKLSINKPTKWNKKTKTQRNKLERHKKLQELSARLKQIKDSMKELERLDEIMAEVEKKGPQKPAAPRDRPYRKHGRGELAFKPIELKLSDELTSCLRSLKPEGNLFYDNMHKLQVSGKVEAQGGSQKRRRFAPKLKERYSYKNFH